MPEIHHLVAIVNGRAVSFALNPGACRIGRGTGNTIALGERSLSREHAEILVEPDRVTIRDLGSSNGTYINGRPIVDAAVIQPGDRIRCGNQEFILRAGPLPAGGEPSDDIYSTPTPARLSNPNEVKTRGHLSIEEARRDLKQAPEMAHALLVAVTDAGQLLTAPRPLEDVFSEVLELVARVVPARRILLLTTDAPGGEPVVRAARPADKAFGQALVLSRTIVATVLEERHSLLLNDVPHDPRFSTKESVVRQNLRSAMVAPLFDEQQVIGLLYADHDDFRSIYSRDQLLAFSLLANLIAIKITNTRLLEAEREKVHLDEELAAAARVQRSMLPAGIPAIPGYSLAARQVPCEQVAGDLYDVTLLTDGRIAFALGDVSGKGMGAALLMSNVIACLRVLYQECLEPSCLAERLHRELLQTTDAEYFVTLFLGILDPRDHRLDFVNAGHNPPLLLRQGGDPMQLESTGLPLGMLEGAEYEAASVDLPAGSLLCVFSDGIPEARVQDDFYGDGRFLESILGRRDQPLEDVAEGLLQDLRAFLGHRRPSDDITLFLVRRGA